MVNGYALLPFSIWISRFRKEKSDRGILSRWFNGTEFRTVNTSEEIIKRIQSMGGTEILVDIFEKCWYEFESVPNARISIASINGKGRKFRKRLD